MTDEKALATREEVGIDLPTSRVLSMTEVGDAERFEQTVVIPPVYQYKMSRWQQPDKVSLTAEAYTYLNRVMGVQLHQPDFVPDKNGRLVPNPIHTDTYIYLRLLGIWRNDLGNLVSYREDIEADFRLVWQDARINARSAKVEGIDEFGLPQVTLSPEDELKALKTFSQLRTFGLRYVQTVARNRILRVASGLSTLPISTPQPFAVRVVGWRDRLTPEERVKQVSGDMKAMFGGTPLDESDTLSPEEMDGFADIEAASETVDELDTNLITEREDIVDSSVRRVGPDDDIPEGIFDEEPVAAKRRK